MRASAVVELWTNASSSADAGSVPVLDLWVPGRMICKVRQDRLVVSIADDENYGKFGAPCLQKPARVL